MTITNETVYTKDVPNKKIFVKREFKAPVEQVWKAWTDAALLDQWWAPRPWKAETKTMDFKAGGMWLYRMAGPDGTHAWCRVDFESINAPQSFKSTSRFCDENGNPDSTFPTMHWEVNFSSIEGGTRVDVTLSFDTEEEMNKIIEMGFQEGFKMGLGNLDELLAQ